MNIVFYVIGQVNQREDANVAIDIDPNEAQLYYDMLDISKRSIERYMIGYDEIRVLDVGKAPWHAIIKQRFHAIKNYCLVGHNVFLADADCMLVKPWAPNWSTQRIKFYHPAPCQNKGFKYLPFNYRAFSRRTGKDTLLMACTPAIFPAANDKYGKELWDLATEGYERTLKEERLQNIEQHAYNMMYFYYEDHSVEDIDRSLVYTLTGVEKHTWDEGIPESAATWFHAYGTKGAKAAYEEMEKRK